MARTNNSEKGVERLYVLRIENNIAHRNNYLYDIDAAIDYTG